MASRRLAISSLLCDDETPKQGPASAPTPTSQPVYTPPRSHQQSPPLGDPHFRIDHSQYLQQAHDALEHAGNTLAYRNPSDNLNTVRDRRQPAPSDTFSSPALLPSPRRHSVLSGPGTAGTGFMEGRSWSPPTAVDSRAGYQEYRMDEGERTTFSTRVNTQFPEYAQPSRPSRHESQSQFRYQPQAPPMQAPSGSPSISHFSQPGSSYSRPGSSASPHPSNHSPQLSYHFSRSPEDRISPSHSPGLNFPTPSQLSLASPILIPQRQASQSPATFYFNQPQPQPQQQQVQSQHHRPSPSLSSQSFQAPTPLFSPTTQPSPSSIPYSQSLPSLSRSQSTSRSPTYRHAHPPSASSTFPPPPKVHQYQHRQVQLQPQPQPQPPPPLQSLPQQPPRSQPPSPYFGLEALVAAATEERRRLSGGSVSEGSVSAMHGGSDRRRSGSGARLSASPGMERSPTMERQSPVVERASPAMSIPMMVERPVIRERPVIAERPVHSIEQRSPAMLEVRSPVFEKRSFAINEGQLMEHPSVTQGRRSSVVERASPTHESHVQETRNLVMEQMGLELQRPSPVLERPPLATEIRSPVIVKRTPPVERSPVIQGHTLLVERPGSQATRVSPPRQDNVHLQHFHLQQPTPYVEEKRIFEMDVDKAEEEEDEPGPPYKRRRRSGSVSELEEEEEEESMDSIEGGMSLLPPKARMHLRDLGPLSRSESADVGARTPPGPQAALESSELGDTRPNIALLRKEEEEEEEEEEAVVQIPVEAVQPPQKPKADEDAHEWLLEQCGVSSRSSSTSFPSPHLQHGPAFEREPGASARQPLSRRAATGSTSTPKRTEQKKSSTPVSILQEELGDVSIKSPSDVDFEIEGALGLTGGSPIEGPPPVGDDGMDVEDELLSLVDDPKTVKENRGQSSFSRHPQTHDKKITHSPPGSRQPTPSQASSQKTRHAEKHSPYPLAPIPTLPSSRHPSLPLASSRPGTSCSYTAPHTSEASDRASMPPPPQVPSGVGGRSVIDKLKAESDGGSGSKKGQKSRSASASASGKKVGMPKVPPKPKQPARPRKKPAPASGTTAKSKPKALHDDFGTSTPTTLTATGRGRGKGKKTTSSTLSVPESSGRGKSASALRSRSTSVMPTAGEDMDKENAVTVRDSLKQELEEEEDEDEKKDDDKLYCVCKTRYDEDRVMIACDRCDEWYHTACVNMPDLEVDLVDQFICPPCVEKNTHLSLHTTYKRRCLFGLKHPTPSSPNACHKPARGILSKYCSEECGIRFMQMRIDAWADKGGDKRKLWENVKDAEKREGVVIRADSKKHKAEPIKTELDESRPPKSKGPVTPPEPKILKPTKTKKDREVERLQKQLDRMMQQREEMKKEMDVIVWRERLTALASERAEKVEECGWDQRLCFGDEEWEEFGEGVLESYEDGGDFMTGNLDGDEGMQVDGATAQHGEWWCRGKKKCERHVGWQKLRAAEVTFLKDMKEMAISTLTTREREIRKHIEDILVPQAVVSAGPNSSALPPKAITKSHTNGGGKARLNGDTSKSGKKRKAVAG